MKSSIADERVAIFIDGSNFYHAVKEQRNDVRVDFEFLVDSLVGGRVLFRVFYYNALPVDDNNDMYEQQKSFFEKIGALPYFEVSLGYIDRKLQKGVDTKMTTDMVVYAMRDTYDTAIIISGDGDFAIPAEVIKSEGKHVEQAFYPGWGKHLLKVADRFIDITPFIRDPFQKDSQEE